MRVVFMGTPDFAVPSLQALIDEEGVEVVGVYAQPDRPAGRGHKLVPGPVKALAQARGIPVYQFEKARSREGREQLEALRPDLVVTAAFGQILSQRMLDVPPLGTLNVHASLLPRHRGSAPINWAIALGEKQTGVTIMFTDRGLDTGDMALWESVDIGPDETAGALSARLSRLGARLLIEAIHRLEKGTLARVKQNEAEMTYEPMLTREDGLIDWRMSACSIDARVRGFDPWPGTYTRMPDGAVLKILAAKALDEPADAAPGTVVVSSAKAGLAVACGEGTLEILQLQAAGGKRMDAKAYLMGKQIPVGTVLGEETDT